MHPIVAKRFVNIITTEFGIFNINQCNLSFINRCIANKVDMVTASYCTDPMQALHKEAQDAGKT